MPGILNAGGAAPAPNPQPNAPSTSQGVLSAPNVGAPPGIMQLRQPYFPGPPQPSFAPPPAQPSAASVPPVGQGPPGATPAAPTYGQTLASMRQFSAIRRQLQRLMREPELGQVSVKGKIVDGIAELVADRILTAADAVQQLGNVPERPYDQKTWLAQQAQLTDEAERTVIAHYRQGIAGMAHEAIDRTGDPSNHFADISALMQHYKRRRGNA